MQDVDKLFIGGEWTDPATSEAFEVVSPHSEEPVARVAAAGAIDVDRAVTAARAAVDSGPWPSLDPADRVAAVRRLAERDGARRKEMAQVITDEMGSPISFSRFVQAGLPAMVLGALADVAERHDWESPRRGHYGQDVLVRKEPVGVVAAIVPWNYPQFLTVGKLGPALLAGCAVVLKPAAETPLDSVLLAEILGDLDLPPGLVSVLPGGGEVGRLLVEHPGVDKVSFTGSTAVGRQVGAAAGAGLKRVSLELGGKSAAIVLDDADPAVVAAGLQGAALANAGQTCVAQTRVLVPAARHDEILDALVGMVDGLVVGDPGDKATEVGPLVTQRQQERVRGYIRLGVQEGARVVRGGPELPDGVDRGWYVRPTVLAGVDNGMRVAREEIFGPVLTVIPYGPGSSGSSGSGSGDDEAVRLANDSDYGLSGSVWTGDRERGLAVARRVRAGSFGVNQAYTMDPAAPFGGMKASGIGRELGSEGLDEYLETKAISVEGGLP